MTNTDTIATSTLDVPGARLHHETRGPGPTLLLIPGGLTGEAGFAPAVPSLAAHHRVAIFDPHGLSHSTREDTEEEITREIQADDVDQLLAELGTEPAHVFASGGSVTALELVIRYPEEVRALVVDEPPVTELLPDSARMATGPEDAALREPPDPKARKAMAGTRASLVLLFEHMTRAITRSRLDVATLRNSTRTAGAGEAGSVARSLNDQPSCSPSSWPRVSLRSWWPLRFHHRTGRVREDAHR